MVHRLVEGPGVAVMFLGEHVPQHLVTELERAGQFRLGALAVVREVLEDKKHDSFYKTTKTCIQSQPPKS